MRIQKVSRIIAADLPNLYFKSVLNLHKRQIPCSKYILTPAEPIASGIKSNAPQKDIKFPLAPTYFIRNAIFLRCGRL